MGDFDGDGNQDLVVANTFWANVSVLLGNGTGNFSAPTSFAVGFTGSVALGDFNGDGKQDLAVADYSDKVSVLLRDCLGASLELTSAASVKGQFGIDLPLNVTPGIECRIGGPNKKYTIAFTFTSNVTAVNSASTTCGRVTSTGVNPRDAHQFLVDIAGVGLNCNGSDITITLSGVHDDQGNTLASAAATMTLLIGDVNGDGTVSTADLHQVKLHRGQQTDSSNLRSDVNASGHIDRSDVYLVNSQLP